ncbi:MAG TPA: efflux transporter outer membrane subunit [Caulobacterales bacterium]|nr:efflux transporter outer membrane subunit [Caulobacterales bacterium]
MVRFSEVTADLAASKLLRGAGALALAVALAACATPPAGQTPAQARAPDSFAAARSFQAPEAAWPAQSWWRAYNDPQLTALIEEGLQGSPTLAEAQARLRAASAAQAAARAAAGPDVTLNAGVREEKQSYNSGIPAAFVPQGYNDYGRATLDFAYDLDFWGRNRAAIAAATSDQRAAEAEAAQARLMLSTAIAEAYADLARLTQERAIAAQALEVRTQTATLVGHRVDSGLDTRGELRQAEAGPPAARAQLAALDEALGATRNRLSALTGAGPDRGLDIAAPAEVRLTAFGLPPNLGADLIGRRPDIVAARWRAEAASARVEGANAAFYPNVNLAAFIGVQSLGLENLTKSGSDVGAIAPALSLPIFDSGRLRANRLRADAERDAAIAAYNGALSEALHQVADVVTSERALSTRLTESRDALSAYEDAYRIARLRYEGGLSNYQAVLIAEDAVLQQRLAVADLEARAFTLDVALVRALGGGYSAS